jgi:putative OmpL-like beta-barrel porin-2
MTETWRRWLAVAVVLAALGPGAPALAQTPAPTEKKEEEKGPQTLWDALFPPASPVAQSPAAAEKKEEKAQTLWDEFKLFAYIENSYTFNLTGAGRDATNELRFYDFDEGWTFNMAEFSIKKDPTEKNWWGMGLVVTAGLDAQKNHSLGIFRGTTDTFPFRNTPWFDLQEAYGSVMLPVGNGLILKGGKFVTLLGFEAIESPNNLNFSRGYLYTLAIPLTHTGGLIQYKFTDWFTLLVGGVLGWDNSKENNGAPSATGQFQFSPAKGLIANFEWIVGPEQADNNKNLRYVLDWVVMYTGIDKLTLGLNVDYGHEEKEAFLTSLDTRSNTDASWYGFAGYVAYDWTDWFRTSLRQEYFKDANGARTGFGNTLNLFSTTLTAQFKIWKGLVARVEYRHDQADEKVFKARTTRPDASGGVVPQSKHMDTISLSLYYSFF